MIKTRLLSCFNRRNLLSLGVAFVLVPSVTPLKGEVYTWTGGSEAGNAWTDLANWSPSTGVPGIDDTAHIDFIGTGNVSVSNSSVGILNVGYADQENFSFGGGSSQRLTLGVTSGSARINKGGTRDVSFLRRVDFTSDTVITVEGGRLIFTRNGENAVLGGDGDLTFEGAGGVSIFSGTSTIFSNNFNGNTLVQNNGTLLINATFNASTTVPAASLTVGNTGTLGGTGAVGRQTTIQNGGTLSPGDSTAGVTTSVATFSNGLAFENGSRFNFELTANTTTGRGTAFDGIDITAGTLSIASDALFDLRLDHGTVDFTDAFWGSAQQWLIFDNATAPLLEGAGFQIGSISQDSLGNNFSVTGGSFSLTQVDNDIYLVYSAIPEPSGALLLLGTGVAAVAWVGRRRFAGKA